MPSLAMYSLLFPGSQKPSLPCSSQKPSLPSNLFTQQANKMLRDEETFQDLRRGERVLPNFMDRMAETPSPPLPNVPAPWSHWAEDEADEEEEDYGDLGDEGDEDEDENEEEKEEDEEKKEGHDEDNEDNDNGDDDDEEKDQPAMPEVEVSLNKESQRAQPARDLDTSCARGNSPNIPRA